MRGTNRHRPRQHWAERLIAGGTVTALPRAKPRWIKHLGTAAILTAAAALLTLGFWVAMIGPEAVFQ